MVTLDEEEIMSGSNSFELYFEEEDLQRFSENIIKADDIRLIHPLMEHPWGQRVLRFYDPDMNIIEVGESMEAVVKRFLRGGMSIEETSKRTQYPVRFVTKCFGQLANEDNQQRQ